MTDVNRTPGYREENGQVILTMSRDDYDWILFGLGALTGQRMRDGLSAEPVMELMNRLNEGNPHYAAYKVEVPDGRR
jgi:hypothetical protein